LFSGLPLVFLLFALNRFVLPFKYFSVLAFSVSDFSISAFGLELSPFVPMNQFFAPLIEPVSIIWCLMVLVCLDCLFRRQWRCAICLGLPTVLLFVIGSTSMTEKLVAREERPWAGGAVDDKSAISNRQSAISYDVVVALGGGQIVSQQEMLDFAREEGASSNLPAAQLVSLWKAKAQVLCGNWPILSKRNFTAIQLVRSGKAKTLVLGGSWPMSGNQDAFSESDVQNWVVSLGLVEGTVTNLGICINTHDEAVAFSPLARRQGWSKVILVTSALHMRRAVAVFQQQGIVVTPVAADFQVLGVPQDWSFSPFPRQQRLFLLSLYLHEKIGWGVYRVRGWL
jgi:uncharacterized SAM-binding protein YcdF (DUF218 family)